MINDATTPGAIWGHFKPYLRNFRFRVWDFGLILCRKALGSFGFRVWDFGLRPHISLDNRKDSSIHHETRMGLPGVGILASMGLTYTYVYM